MSRTTLVLLIFFFSLSNILSQASIIRRAGVILNATKHIVDIYDEKYLPLEPVEKLSWMNLKPIDYSKYLKQPNSEALQKVLNQNSLSSKEKADAYSLLIGKITNDLSVDSLTMPSKAIQDILVNGNTEGRSSFLLEDVIPVGQEIKGGIYTANSKISLGDDGAGNKFFDISDTYKPGDQVPYFGIPSDATKTSFRNRLYYKPNEKSASEIRINNVNLGIKKLREYKSFQTAKSPVRKLLTDFD